MKKLVIREGVSKGFSFIELLVVLAIMGILLGISSVSFRGANKNARDTKRQADLQIIKGAVESYRLENGEFPDTINDLIIGNYLSSGYEDPKGGEGFNYVYQSVLVPGCSYVVYGQVENPTNAKACPTACGINPGFNIYCLSE